MRRIILAGLLATLSIAVLAAPVAAKPAGPSGPPDSAQEFDAGVVCSFPIRLDEWSDEKVRVGVDKHGHPQTIVTGTARTRVVRLDHRRSVTINSGGLVVISEPGDDTSRLRAIGKTLFYFFPGDQNPTGEGNGLFLVSGYAEQTLDLSQDLVTRFAYRGKVRDVCAELS